MNQSPNRNMGKPTSHRKTHIKVANSLGAAFARLELVAYYVQLYQVPREGSHLIAIITR